MVSSHFTRHLLEVWDHAFDIMHRATPVGRSINRHSLAHNCKTALPTGGIPKAKGLGKVHISTYQCKKVYHTLRGNFYHYICMIVEHHDVMEYYQMLVIHIKFPLETFSHFKISQRFSLAFYLKLCQSVACGICLYFAFIKGDFLCLADAF